MIQQSSTSSIPSPTSFGSFDTASHSTAHTEALGRLMTATDWDSRTSKRENGDGPSSELGGEALAHSQALSTHLYHSGFLRAEYSDIDLNVLNSVYKLHRIVLSRSPYLAHLMGSGAPGLAIRVPILDGSVTDESVRIVLENLYAPATSLITPTNARAVLATAFTFGGMPELCVHAYDVARQSLSSETVLDYVQWIDKEGTSPGYSAVESDEGSGGWREDSMLKYGEWSSRIKQDIITFIIRTLPTQLTAGSSSSISSNTTLISIYSALPFILLKRCIESPAFRFGSDQERFQFAKKVVAARKKTTPSTLEETVVLAFKGDAGSAVHLTQKNKRKAALWKVEQ